MSWNCLKSAVNVFLALKAANDFEMRVVKRVEAMSMQILWLVYEKPHVHCRHRLRIATDLLAKPRA